MREEGEAHGVVVVLVVDVVVVVAEVDCWKVRCETYPFREWLL